MPWSDEERLERVYRRAASIRLVRRARVLAVALPLLVLAGAVVASAASTGDGRTLQVAGPDATDDTVTTTTVPLSIVGTVVPPVTTPTTVPTTFPPKVPVTSPTLVPRPPDAENCGGYVQGDSERPQPPEGMQVAMEVSDNTVRRGDVVVLTMRARWTGSQPYTHNRHAAHLVYVHLNGPIFYSSQYDPSWNEAPPPQETFQPGEEKTYTVRWDTSQSCGPGGMQEGWLKAGAYTVEGTWDDTSGTWVGQPVQFELVD